MERDAGAKVKGLGIGRWESSIRGDRDLPEEGSDMVDVLGKKVVEREHVRLLRPKQDIIGQILDDLGDQ